MAIINAQACDFVVRTPKSMKYCFNTLWQETILAKLSNANIIHVL